LGSFLAFYTQNWGRIGFELALFFFEIAVFGLKMAKIGFVLQKKVDL
jgi:hypothetical protein